MVRLGSGSRRHEAARARRHRPRRRRPGPLPPDRRRSAAPPFGRSPPARSARPRTTTSSSRRARHEAGVEVEVISGRRGGPAHPPRRAAGPARLRPAPAAVRHRRRQHRVARSASGAEVLAARSLKLGAVRLTNRFFPGERLHPSAVDAVPPFVRSTLSSFDRAVEPHGFDVAVGSSGTIEQIVRHGGAPRPASRRRARSTAPRSHADEVERRGRALIAAATSTSGPRSSRASTRSGPTSSSPAPSSSRG